MQYHTLLSFLASSFVFQLLMSMTNPIGPSGNISGDLEVGNYSEVPLGKQLDNKNSGCLNLCREVQHAACLVSLAD